MFNLSKMIIKELSIEQKAKAYDEALDRAKYALNDGTISNNTIAYLQDIFPELKESEDEKVRKAIISGMKALQEKGKCTCFANIPMDKVFAWLEKQDEKERDMWKEGNIIRHGGILALVVKGRIAMKSNGEVFTVQYPDEWVKASPNEIEYFYNNLEKQGKVVTIDIDKMVNDYTNNKERGNEEFGKPVNCMIRAYRQGINDAISTLVLKKQGGQKPADKVEPKFQNGQWIVWENKCYKVNYNGCGYELIDQNGLRTSLEYGTVDKCARIWNIHDAKDGDVLAESKGDVILMFRGIGNTEWNDVIDYYCCYDRHRKKFIFQKDLKFWGCVENNQLKPATKEQRELFFQKMKEEEYTFDFKKKELKKIEQQSSQWNISDYKTWQYIVDDVLTKYWGIGQYLDDIFCKKIAKDMQKEWNKKLSLEQNPTISDSSTRLENKYPNAVSIAYLQNWYQDSIDETKEPIWTNKHLEELVNDFYLIPK